MKFYCEKANPIRKGDVIELKKDTMQRRNQARHGGPPVLTSKPRPIQKRSKFDGVADEVV